MSTNPTLGSVMDTMIDLDVVLDVEYTMDEPFEEMHNGKYYPITIKDVKFRGHSIYNYLHISHVMALQRRVYNRIIDHMIAVSEDFFDFP